MNNIIQTIRHAARAATVLLIALLAAQTAWAQEDVSDADGLAEAFSSQGVSEINVTADITGVGDLSLFHDLTINLNGHTISGDYLNFNDAGRSLTINGGGQDGSVGNIISGHADAPAILNVGTVTLSHVNITTNFDLTIWGSGTLNIGDNVSFNGWTVMPFDTPNVKIIEGGNYNYAPRDPFANVVATVTVGGTPHYFENSDAALAYIVSHPDNDDFSLSGDTYTINTATGWDAFCYLLANNDKGYFSGKTVKLGADIGTADDPVSRMAGSPGHDFTGTFDGDDHTLTFSATAAENYCAPFRFVEGTSESHAVIHNLSVVTTITSAGYRHAAGLIALQGGYVDVINCNATVNITSTIGANNDTELYPAALVSQVSSGSQLTVSGCTTSGTISTDGKYAGGMISIVQGAASVTDCRSSVTINSSTSGDGAHGGIIAALTDPNSTTTIAGTVFDGSLLGPSTNSVGGFIGIRNSAAAIYNSLFAPAEVTVSNAQSATFSRNYVDTYNCYYTYLLCDGTNYKPGYDEASSVWRNGKACHSVTAGDGVTIDAVALTGDATQYTTSGITAYSGGGLQLGENLYYGSDDQLSLTLSNTGAPEGYQYGYTVSAGTLEGSTLTMSDEDVTISVNTAVLTAIPWTGGGTKGNPFLIEYPSQLDLLAHRVNGTHGETLQEDGYSGKYFKLNNDISYTHTSDWNAFTSNESNFEAIGGWYNSNSRSFCGHFDGNNKTISGIRIYKDGSSRADKYQGIFGQTRSSADIHDLTLADARITGYDNTGGIVGENDGGKVTNCHVASDVCIHAVQNDASYHGGIAGYNDGGTIEQCTSAATITTADAANSLNYGGIAGDNRGTLRDNLAIGATVPAAKDNTYGAITGINHGTLQRNYYAACKVADEENATGVGCEKADINNDNNPNGAVPGYFLTLGEGITIADGATTITIPARGETAEVTYHVAAAGAEVTLSNSLPGDAPEGYQYAYTASAGTLEGSTLTMPDEDVTVSPTLRSTHVAVPVSYVDADGNTQTHDAIALDGTENSLGAEWYFVGLPTVAFDHMLELNADVNLILPDGCTMNVTSSDDYGIDVCGFLTIYGQTDGTGTLNATGGGYGINSGIGITISGGTVTATGVNEDGIFTLSGTITISGGRVTATGYDGIHTYSGTITLGLRNATDYIYASSFYAKYGNIIVKDGQTLTDGTRTYSGSLGTELSEKTLYLYTEHLDLAANLADGNYWTTFYCGHTGYKIDEGENAWAYTAEYDAGNARLTLHKLGKVIPKGTAVILVGDDNSISMTASSEAAQNTVGNDLRGVDVDTDVDDITSDLGDGTFYVLGMTTVNNEQHFGFHRYTGSTMAAHKAFVLVDNSQALARSLTMVFDEATGIESLTPDAAPKAQAAEHWFTLDGRRLQAKPTAPGIYVNNGRKVVIK